MKDKTSVTSSLSNKQSLTDAQVNAGFGFNTILESPDLNGQLYDIDSQVNIITKELCNFLTDNGVTLNSNDNTQLKTLMTALFAAKQNTLTAGANITIDENGVISAAAGELPNVPLFFHTWFDFKPANISWVNASNYSWLYGSMYQAAYQALVDQYTPTGIFVADTSYYNCQFSDGQVVITTVPSNSGTLQQLKDWCDANSYTYNAAASIDELECYKTVPSSSETVAGTTITYYRTFNDMKIVVGDTQIANAESIYNSTGVAWYYILDTVNQRFKLPRTKFAETGLRDTAYGNSTTVQPPATQMYLYFYIGNYTMTAIENTAGLNASLFNDKAGINLENITTTAKGTISNLSSPNITFSSTIAMGNNSICPTDGVLRVSVNCDSGREVVVRVNGQAVAGNHWTRVANYSGIAYWSVCPVSKGDVITFAGQTGYVELCSFFPTKGGV